ncbi:MAG TPA: RecX family transcriptional regulator [Anaerolineae bacterium]|nr:RecX family transcriptional regulator [Anaerolineae bacterium]HOR00706.1 RecX family transcriptional regulator [Anaerolineae bacterium]HPL26945.1 RecX family transcriptional regulator [Anaerolineae bacterium]
MAGKITALRAQTKNKGRVNVYLDGAFAFGLPDIVAAGLRIGQELSDADIAALRQHDSLERAYDRALRFLSYRPRSSEEVRRYLAGKQVAEEVASEVLQRLARAGLVDDAAFARFWVENRTSFRPRGASALRYELRRKGIGESAIEAAVAAVDEDGSAYQAAQARAARLLHVDRDTFYRRLGEFLRRRGFSYATARDAVERLWRERSGDTPESLSEKS